MTLIDAEHDQLQPDKSRFVLLCKSIVAPYTLAKIKNSLIMRRAQQDTAIHSLPLDYYFVSEAFSGRGFVVLMFAYLM